MTDAMNNTNEMNSMIWASTLKKLETLITRPQMETWFKSSEMVAYYGNHIIIKVKNDFAKNMMNSTYFSIVKNCLEELLNDEIHLEFVSPQEESKAISSLLDENGYNDEDFDSSRTIPSKPIIQAPRNSSSVGSSTDLQESGLNSQYTFDNFVIGNSNRMAHAACVGVADNISSGTTNRIYNPLFIYGGAGLGKTHLMHAIGNQILKHKPHSRIKYVSSEHFMNELINSIRNNTNASFRDKYRNVDVLMIDDIQFLGNKESTQEEFFHTFNALYDSNKQIIITSDKQPREIPNLEDRLRTRFSQGLLTDIQSPDYETRIAILKKKADADHLDIDDEVFEYIAENMQSNIRELEGSLCRLALVSQTLGERITTESAKAYLENIITPNAPLLITGEMVQQKVAEYYNIRVEDFKVKRRTKDIAYPRQIAMYLCRELTELSLPKIGEMFGGRDHSTVIHAYDKISTELKSDANLQATLETIRKSFNVK